MPILGRTAELAVVDDLLDHAASGLSLLALTGEAGIGKTTIWAEGVRRARERGALVLTTRCAESELGLPFSGLGDLFGTVSNEVLLGIPAPQREAVGAALLRERCPPTGVDDRSLCAGVLSLLRLLAGTEAVVVAVDDAHWLDAPTARVLRFAVRRLDTEPIGFLLTRRRAPVGAGTFDEAADPGRRQVRDVGALPIAVLHGMITDRLGRSLPRPTLAQIARVTDGNPFYALEIATDLPPDRPFDALLPVPVSVQGLVERKLDRLPGPTQRALLAVAAMARPSLGSVPEAALVPAETAGLVSISAGGVRFEHPLFASAVYGRAEPSVRRRVHRQLAAVVTDPEERVRHLALGAGRPDQEIASELDGAAVMAARRGAPDAAAELVELAIRLTPTQAPAARTARHLEAARHWFDAGDLSRAQELLGRVEAGSGPGTLRAQALALLGRVRARQSAFSQAIGLAYEALEASGDDPSLHVHIEMDLTYCFVSIGDMAGARQHSAAAVRAAERAAEPGALADALAVSTMADFLCGEGLDEARLAAALAKEDHARNRAFQNAPSFVQGLLLLWTDRPGEARACLEEVRRCTIEHGEEGAVPLLCLYLTWACLWAGDLRGATHWADEARRVAALLGDPGAGGGALTASALVHAQDGSADQARRDAREAVECFERIGWWSGTIWPLWALGLAELSTAHPAAADAALGAVADRLTAAGAIDPILGVFVPDEVEALVELGQLDRAAQLTCWFEARATAAGRRWALAAAKRCRGLLHAAGGRLDMAIDCLTSALDDHDAALIPLEHGRTLLVLGRVLRRDGKRAQAIRALERSRSVLEQVGAVHWSARAQAELDRLGRRRCYGEALTPTEALMADLGASGLSNREIADRTFVTVKTVEANLTRAYRKLGIRSRAALATALAGSPPPRPPTARGGDGVGGGQAPPTAPRAASRGRAAAAASRVRSTSAGPWARDGNAAS